MLWKSSKEANRKISSQSLDKSLDNKIIDHRNAMDGKGSKHTIFKTHFAIGVT